MLLGGYAGVCALMGVSVWERMCECGCVGVVDIVRASFDGRTSVFLKRYVPHCTVSSQHVNHSQTKTSHPPPVVTNRTLESSHLQKKFSSGILSVKINDFCQTDHQTNHNLLYKKQKLLSQLEKFRFLGVCVLCVCVCVLCVCCVVCGCVVCCVCCVCVVWWVCASGF